MSNFTLPQIRKPTEDLDLKLGISSLSLTKLLKTRQKMGLKNTMVKKAIKNPLIEQFRISIQDAYKKGNIPQLNVICQNIIEMLKHGEDFRRNNAHIELGSYYTETDQLVNLYSQTLRMINKTENPHLTILGRRN